MAELKRVTETSVVGILRSPELYDWTIHGLGFLRLYISDVQRLHIWDRSLATPDATRIHDHPWNFESWVMRGRLVNRRYMIVPGAGSYRISTGSEEVRPARRYSKQLLICGAGGVTLEEPEDVFLVERAVEVFTGPSVYAQRKNEIHSTEAEDGTVSLIQRTFEGSPDRANVYFAADEKFVSVQFRTATPEEVETVTQNALARWFPEVPGRPNLADLETLTGAGVFDLERENK